MLKKINYTFFQKFLKIIPLKIPELVISNKLIEQKDL